MIVGRAWGGVALLCVALGCYDPQIGEGALGCADGGTCPRGFSCGSGRRCWRLPPADAGDDGHLDSGRAADRPPIGDAGGGHPAAGAAGSGRGGMGGAGGAAGVGGAGGPGGGGRGGTAGGASTGGTGGRVVEDASAPDGRPDASTTSGKQPLGSPCAAGSACDSGLCVDGLCCDGACTGSCEACDTAAAPGQCSPVTSGAPHGGRVACAGTGACAGSCAAASRSACTFPGQATVCRLQSCTGATLTPAASCDGAGACAAAGSQACGGNLACDDGATACLTSCRGDGDCRAPAPYCAAGVCTAARRNGSTCSGGTDCQEGRCVDGVCCDEACGESCQACDVPGHVGTCWPTPAHQDPHGQRAVCSGSGACAGTCDGAASTCTFPGAETACPCSLLSGTCNGAGQCQNVGSICL